MPSMRSIRARALLTASLPNHASVMGHQCVTDRRPQYAALNWTSLHFVPFRNGRLLLVASACQPHCSASSLSSTPTMPVAQKSGLIHCLLFLVIYAAFAVRSACVVSTCRVWANTGSPETEQNIVDSSQELCNSI